MEELTSLVVVLARGGSKGLPLKALALVAGKPLVRRTIEHAQAARLPRAVVLTSDNLKILDVGRRHGVEVCERPAEMATDQASVDAPARHAVRWWEMRHGAWVDQVVLLYGNVPFRPPDLIDRALAKLTETGADSVESVCSVGKMHPFWMKRLGGTGGDVLLDYDGNNVFRRQDLPPVYMLDGGIIAVTRKSLFDFDPAGAEPHRFLGTDRRAILTQPGEVVDVDDALDLALAQAIAAQRKEAA
jgi:CMP-N-acetylneuraminic acid synthetase